MEYRDETVTLYLKDAYGVTQPVPIYRVEEFKKQQEKLKKQQDSEEKTPKRGRPPKTE